MSQLLKIVLVVALFTILGCAERDDFIISVNRHRLTNEMVAKRVSMMEAVQSLAGKKVRKAELKRFRKKLTSTYPRVFVSDSILTDYMEAEGLTLPAQHLAKFSKKALLMFKKKKIGKWADAMSKLGDHAGEFAAQVESEARRSFLLQHWAEVTPTNVTPEVIAAELRKIDDFNIRMTATNALIFARATNVWNRLCSGEDFRQVAATCSDIKEERKDKGEWAKLDWQQMAGDAELIKYARKLNPGEFSPPIEADNGLMILRVDKKDEKECSMSRIFFQLYMLCAVPTKDALEARIKEDYAKRLFREKYEALKACAEIRHGSQYQPPRPKAAKPKALE